jgi:hypothetical protein
VIDIYCPGIIKTMVNGITLVQAHFREIVVMNGITSIIGVHPNNGWHTIANCIMVTRVAPWAELLSAFQAFTGDDAFVIGNAHITKFTSHHQGCALDTMVTPWAELIHRTRITSWAELLSAFQAEEFLCGVHLMVQKFYDFPSANSAEMTNFATAK